MKNSKRSFTLEEIYLIGSYGKRSRKNLINDIIKSIAFVDDPEVIDLINSVIQKLKRISDIEFSKIDFNNNDYEDIPF